MRTSRVAYVSVKTDIPMIYCDTCGNCVDVQDYTRGWGKFSFITKCGCKNVLDVCPTCVVKKFPEVKL